MNKVRIITIFIFLAVMLAASGCLEQTITDDKLASSVQAFLDAPAQPPTSVDNGELPRKVDGGPSNLRIKDYLLTEERAAIEEFTIYRNILKLRLIKGTDKILWEPIASKVARAFAMSGRDYQFLEATYNVELRIVGEDEEGEFVALVGDVKFQNSSERVDAALYNIGRERRK